MKEIIAMRINYISGPEVKRLLQQIIERGGEGGALRKYCYALFISFLFLIYLFGFFLLLISKYFYLIKRDNCHADKL
jgi:hypothetical protein